MVKKFLINAAFLISFFCVFSSVAKAEITPEAYKNIFIMEMPIEKSAVLCNGHFDQSPECAAEAGLLCMDDMGLEQCKKYEHLYSSQETRIKFDQDTKRLYKFVSSKVLETSDVAAEDTKHLKAGDVAVFISLQYCSRSDSCIKKVFFEDAGTQAQAEKQCLINFCEPYGQERADHKTQPYIAIVRKTESNRWDIIDRFPPFARGKSVPNIIKKLAPASVLPW